MTAQKYYSVSYDAKVWALLLILIIGLSLTTFSLKESFFTKNLIVIGDNQKNIYLYEPPYLEVSFDDLEIDYDDYQKKLAQFMTANRDLGLSISKVDTLDKITPKAILILLDTIALSSKDEEIIQQHLKKGGALLFNSSSGFRNDASKYKGDAFIHNITGLSLSKEYGYLQFKEGLIATPKLLSPLTKQLSSGPALDLVIYDQIPLFTMPKDFSADVYMTNYAQATYPNVNGKSLPKEESGLVWHGINDQGKWVYTSLPLYTLMEAGNSSAALLKLYRGMINYLDKDVLVQAYPYLDAKSISFVSEDTEYRYESVGQFSKLSDRYKIPTTIFCVATLAKENSKLMQEVITNPYLEVGSHSYDHKAIINTSTKNYLLETEGSKKLLETVTGKEIRGFRPPREEIDTQLLNDLVKSGFTYILNLNEPRLTPYFSNNIMIIPRHGTDDYSYLVNLDWGPQEIANNMIKESHFYQELNGIYTMSTHTHLMNFSTNISILESYYKSLQKSPDIISMNGKMIYDRLSVLPKISLHVISNEKSITVKITNQASSTVKNYTFRLYSTPKEISALSTNTEATLQVNKIRLGVYDVIVSELKAGTQTQLKANYTH